MTPVQITEAYELLRCRRGLLEAKKTILDNNLEGIQLSPINIFISVKSAELAIQAEIDIIENDLLNLGVVCSYYIINHIK